MSKTYKDEPRYVKLRKEKFHFTWNHKPHIAGLKGWISVPLLDDEGNYQTQIVTYTDYKWGEYSSGELTYEYFYKVEKQYVAIKQGKKIVRSFKDHCTCGEEPVRTTSKINRNPCTKEFTKAAKVKRYSRQYKKENYEGDEKRTKQKLNMMVKTYNTENQKEALYDDLFQTIHASKTPLFWG